jgi:putative FmdB family regulatory protein
MPRYDYRCSRCGDLEVLRPIGTAPPQAKCPRCGDTARRVFSPPMIAATQEAVQSLRAESDRSREAPAIAHRSPETQAPAAPGRARPELEKLVGSAAAQRLRSVPHPASPAGHRRRAPHPTPGSP